MLPVVSLSPGLLHAEDKVLFSMPAKTIQVDGDLKDWDRSAPVKLNRGNCFSRNGYVKDDADCSALLYSNFDDENLYFALEARDNELQGPDSGGAIYSNDGVELWLDNRLDSCHADANQEDDDYQILVSYTTGGKKGPAPGFWVHRNPNTVQLFAASEVAAKKTNDGYILEIALPVSGLNGLNAKKGKAAGFNISLVDRHDKGFNRLLWSGKSEADPRQYGLLVFGNVPPETLAAIQKRAQDARNRTPDEGKTTKKTSDIDRKNYKGNPKILDVSQNEKDIECYEKLELTVALLAEYGNPYDFDDINLQAHIVSPSGKKITIDGFYYQPHFANSIGYRMRDNLQPIGEPTWKVRFTPTETGEYRYHLTLRDNQGRTAETKLAAFQAVKGDGDGFLRVSKTDPYYLAFDSGKCFYGIGFGMHYWNETPTDILKMLQNINLIAAFGGNYTSVNFQTLGNSPLNLTVGNDLTHFSQPNGWRTDFLLEASRRRGLYVIPNLVQTTWAISSHWKQAPFNKDNGGPCDKPEDFFTNSDAKRLMKRQFRYMIARWGYSPNILGWELVNEMNYMDGFQKNIQSVRDWHREMSGYLKEIDPNRHLVSTTFGSSWIVEDPDIWRLPDIDYITTHKYPNDATDMRYMQWYKRQYRKPIIGGEYGMAYPHVNDAPHFDPEGLYVHNGLWTCAMTGSAGNVLFWWDSNYLIPTDAARWFKPFSRFIEGIPWTTAGFEPVEFLAIKTDVENGDADMLVPTRPAWEMNSAARYEVQDGVIWVVSRDIDKSITDAKIVDFMHRRALEGSLPALLFGSNQKDFAKDLVITIHAGKSCRMNIPVTAVARDGATLNVELNGKVIQTRKISDTDGKNDPGAGELTETFSLPLSAGENRVVLRNTGRGWARLGDITLKDYTQAAWERRALVIGLRGKTRSLLWFHNRENNSQRRLEGPAELTPIRNISVTLNDVADGEHEIEWWNTQKGKITGRQKVLAKDGSLTVTPPTFSRDIACKIRRIE
ncbi:MAG: DUF5060 domain-containing protein [Phycisphaerae bacterium]|nr:DUF5060 domain-containing protein [Phycisphaerae bacterium]